MSDKPKKDNIMDLTLWSNQMAETVRQICLRKQSPCVAFSLIFFDPFVTEEERWNFVIKMAYDMNDPPPEEDRKKLETALTYISEGVKRIMTGEFDGGNYDKDKLS